LERFIIFESYDTPICYQKPSETPLSQPYKSSWIEPGAKQYVAYRPVFKK
jgi:hypothetical protein